MPKFDIMNKNINERGVKMENDNQTENTIPAPSQTLISFTGDDDECGDFIFRWDVKINENETRSDFPHWMDGYAEIISSINRFHQKISICILPEDLEMLHKDLLSFYKGHKITVSFEPLEPNFGFDLKRTGKYISIDGYLDKGCGCFGMLRTTFTFTIPKEDLKNALSAIEKMLKKFAPLSEFELLPEQIETPEENKDGAGTNKILKFLKSLFNR